MVHNVADVVFLDNFIREDVDGYFHIPEGVHGIFEVEVRICRAEPCSFISIGYHTIKKIVCVKEGGCGRASVFLIT